MVAEYECCGYCECAVEEFCFRVHVFEDVEHCDVVSKGCNKTCRTCSVHAEHCAEFFESFTEFVGDEFYHGVCASENDSDVTAGKKTRCKAGSTSVVSVNSTGSGYVNHVAEEREEDTSVGFEDCDSGHSSDEDGDAGTEFVEAFHHCRRCEPKASSDSSSDDNNGDHVDEDFTNGEFVRGHCVHAETTSNAAYGDGYNTNESTCTEVRTIFRIDDTKSYRNGEYDGRAHHGAEDKTSVVTDCFVSSHSHSKRITAHVASEKGGSKHGSICANKAVDRSNDGVEYESKDRSNCYYTSHGYCERAHAVKAFFPLFAITKFVTHNFVNCAPEHEEHHDHNNNRVDCKAINPSRNGLSKERKGFVPCCNEFREIEHNIDLLKNLSYISNYIHKRFVCKRKPNTESLRVILQKEAAYRKRKYVL